METRGARRRRRWRESTWRARFAQPALVDGAIVVTPLPRHRADGLPRTSRRLLECHSSRRFRARSRTSFAACLSKTIRTTGTLSRSVSRVLVHSRRDDQLQDRGPTHLRRGARRRRVRTETDVAPCSLWRHRRLDAPGHERLPQLFHSSSAPKNCGRRKTNRRAVRIV
jgi:hypothetical protein